MVRGNRRQRTDVLAQARQFFKASESIKEPLQSRRLDIGIMIGQVIGATIANKRQK